MHVIPKGIFFSLLVFLVKCDIGDFQEAETFSLLKDLQSLTSCTLSHIVYSIFGFTSSDVNYLLFTRKNPNEPCDLQPNEEALQQCNFNPNAQTIVLVHGWIGDLPEDDLKFVIKDKLLERDEYNVVVHNWTSYTQFTSPQVLGYPLNSFLTFFIGLRMAAWIKFLEEETGAKPEMFHLNGHSLGAHVVSFAGKATCNLGRITFMDAAGPLFRFLPWFLNPTYSDASLTQGIHTNGAYILFEGYGLKEPYAHIDYFPNGGSEQTKCRKGEDFRRVDNSKGIVDSSSNQISCNHYAVYEYYLASFDKNCRFIGLVCSSYEAYKSGKCNVDNAAQCEMDFDLTKKSDLPLRSKCYFDTLNHYPYCLN